MSRPTPSQSAQQKNRDGSGQYQTRLTHEPPTGLTDPHAAARAAVRPDDEPLNGKPLSPYEMGRRYNGDSLTAGIPVALENIDVNRDGFHEGLFKELTGVEATGDLELDYRASSVADDGKVVFRAEAFLEPEEFEDLLTPEQYGEFLAGQADQANQGPCNSVGPRIGTEGRPICEQPAGHDGSHFGFLGSGFEDVTW